LKAFGILKLIACFYICVDEWKRERKKNPRETMMDNGIDLSHYTKHKIHIIILEQRLHKEKRPSNHKENRVRVAHSISSII
jgi:hypothetical protein